MGEDGWRIHRVGSPGIDGILRAATVSVQAEDRGHLWTAAGVTALAVYSLIVVIVGSISDLGLSAVGVLPYLPLPERKPNQPPGTAPQQRLPLPGATPPAAQGATR